MARSSEKFASDAGIVLPEVWPVSILIALVKDVAFFSGFLDGWISRSGPHRTRLVEAFFVFVVVCRLVWHYILVPPLLRGVPLSRACHGS